jgi:hypothetical protein
MNKASTDDFDTGWTRNLENSAEPVVLQNSAEVHATVRQASHLSRCRESRDTRPDTCLRSTSYGNKCKIWGKI